MQSPLLGDEAGSLVSPVDALMVQTADVRAEAAVRIAAIGHISVNSDRTSLGRTIETERLVLRPFVPEDAEAVHAYRQDPEVMRLTRRSAT